MNRKIQMGQGAVWIILIIAIIALIALWISKNPSNPISTTAPTATESAEPTIVVSITPTPSKTLIEIEKALNELNSSSTDIDKGINDTQLDITQ